LIGGGCIETELLWAGFLFALVATFYFYRVRAKERAILCWPQIAVRVVPGSIRFVPAGRLFAGMVGDKQGLRIAAAEFEYEQNGLFYKSRKTLPVNWTLQAVEQERVQQELETFAVAFFNPADPAESYLDLPDRWQRGSISWITAGLIVSIWLTLVFVRLLWVLYL
jgi:hypothetical protein